MESADDRDRAPAGDWQDGDIATTPQPADEQRRLRELRALGLLDTAPDERFDRITRLAQRVFDVPIALVSLIDEDRQWFKSRVGLDVSETDRAVAFCSRAIERDEVLHVPDAHADIRFAQNPLVTGDPHIRFYAGHPIKGPDGAKLGTLCVIGREPRELTDLERLVLRDLAEVVEHEIATTRTATTDALTGLSNRRGLEVIGEKVLETCGHLGLPASLLYADLDGLKAVNDTEGHAAGDRMLVAFARLLEETFRESDVIARLGGDEFVVLLSAAAAGPAAAQRLRRALERRSRAAEEPRLSASIGVASIEPANRRGLDDLLRSADHAMYEDKRLVSEVSGPTI